MDGLRLDNRPTHHADREREAVPGTRPHGRLAEVRVLLVEDDANAAFLIRETLRDQFGDGCVRHCRRVSEALAFDLSEIDLVLTDMKLPDGTGLELLGRLLERRPDLPIVLVTGEGIFENAIAAIRRGAYDYVVKAGDYLFAIPLVVEKNLALYRIKQENLRLQEQLGRSLDEVRLKNAQLEEAVRQLETVAATDPLTGLANRRAFESALERSFAEAQRHRQDLALLMIDLDGFKGLNDSLGHRQGDAMLQLAARVLEANCRRSDVAARYGGDEFIVLLPQTDEPESAAVAGRIAEEFAARVAAALADNGFAGRLTMSMGLSTVRVGRPVHPEQLLEQADHALYCAKQGGKKQLMIYRPSGAGMQADCSDAHAANI